MYTLYRNGIFISAELGDFSALLYRLGRVCSLFTLPHPLSKVASQAVKGNVTQDDEALISVESFHKKFMNYLVQNRFYSFIHHYLDSYG